jgi:hypothetical protein
VTCEKSVSTSVSTHNAMSAPSIILRIFIPRDIMTGRRWGRFRPLPCLSPPCDSLLSAS